MADDIMPPLLINPKVSTIFVISTFDPCFSSKGTWESQKDDIKRILIDGNDKDSYSRRIYIDESDEKSVHYLKSKSIITDDQDDGKIWRLSFKYNGRPVKLIYYHHRNFLIEWLDEIINIKQVLMMGAFSWTSFVDTYSKYDSKTIIHMLETRTTKPFEIYALSFNHKHFPKRIKIKSGQERPGTKIAIIQIKDTDDPEWIEQVYDPMYLSEEMDIDEFQ